MIKTPSPSYSIIVRLEIVSKPGMLGKVTSAIGKAGGDIGAVDIVGFKKNITIRDIIVSVANKWETSPFLRRRLRYILLGKQFN